MMLGRFVIGFMISTSAAWAGEYRSVTLADGRVIAAEIKGITATTMTLDTPQGVVEISPNDLRTMDALSAEEYQNLPPWKVLVLPFSDDGSEQANDDAHTAQLYALRVLQSIPAVSAITINDLPPTVPENTRSALSLCGTDLQCATRNGEIVQADAVIMGNVETQDAGMLFTLGGIFVNAPSARKRTSIEYSTPLLEQRNALAKAPYDVLFLSPPDDGFAPNLAIAENKPMGPEKKKAAPEKQKRTAPGNLANLAWAPVPGITALKTKNNAGFATALGTVTVGTAASVYVAGHSTYSAPQMVAVTALSSYGLTVLVNHLFVK